MLYDLAGFTREMLHALELIAVLCGIALFFGAALSLLWATFRVAVLGRVLVLPFSGKEDRRIELTDLFVEELTQLEREWVRLAKQVQATRDEVNGRAQREDKDGSRAKARSAAEGRLPPLAGGVSLPSARNLAPTSAAPRTSDSVIEDVAKLRKAGDIGGADRGVITLAGVSFSLHDILALLRAAPGVLARRVLRGSIVPVGGAILLSVEYEERIPFARRRVAELVEVQNDEWRSAVRDLAFNLAKRRVYLIRERRGRWKRRMRLVFHLAGKPVAFIRGRRRRSKGTQSDSDRLEAGVSPNHSHPIETRSETVSRAVIEADSWAACRAFLIGYNAHLIHLWSGHSDDRDEAITSYDKALESQPDIRELRTTERLSSTTGISQRQTSGRSRVSSWRRGAKT